MCDFVCLFWLQRTACIIIVPQTGVEPMAPAVEAQSPNYRTARKFPGIFWN